MDTDCAFMVAKVLKNLDVSKKSCTFAIQIPYSMKKHILFLLPLLLVACHRAPQVLTRAGFVQGFIADQVETYLGVPYAQAPIGDLRWREPQAVQPYDTVLMADHFRADPIQMTYYSDMIFRGKGQSEDCLYLNIWKPAKSDAPLPVLIYFNGGGWTGGSGSEPRYDGHNIAKKGLIAITANYRLGIFGFMAHPTLTARSEHHTSGNYGLLDQVAAIQWVKDNIAAFGGDPHRITIAGESAGSFSVSVMMASPLAKDNLAGCIGSSGAEFGPRYSAVPLAENEQKYAHLMEMKGLKIEELLSASAGDLVQLFSPMGMSAASIDGYLLTEPVEETFLKNEQAQVPLLAGWNSKEMSPSWIMSGDYSLQAFRRAQGLLFGDRWDEVLALYAIRTDEDVLSQKGIDLMSDMFTGLATWTWCEAHRVAGHKVYRYYFLPARPSESDGLSPDGAVHSAEIEYAMNNLSGNKVYRWSTADYVLADRFSTYYARFVKSGVPSDTWDALSEKGETMLLDRDSCYVLNRHEVDERYRALLQVGF